MHERWLRRQRSHNDESIAAWILAGRFSHARPHWLRRASQQLSKPELERAVRRVFGDNYYRFVNVRYALTVQAELLVEEMFREFNGGPGVGPDTGLPCVSSEMQFRTNVAGFLVAMAAQVRSGPSPRGASRLCST